MYNYKTADLHLHTTASDGSDTPATLVAKAKELGLEVISITDHDTLAGLEEALSLSNEDIEIIPGIEFSCHAYVENGFDCHILGYGFDKDNEAMRAAIEHGRQMRFAKLESRITYLKDNFDITLSDDEIAELRSYNSVAKPHIARILIRRGLAESVADAIDKYLKGAKFPDDRIDAGEAIDAIHRAGGVAVYAHPIGGERERRLLPYEAILRIKALKELGIDGIEVYYSRYSEKDQEFLKTIAFTESLYMSAGSDYHGENKTVKLGEICAEERCINPDNVSVLKKIKR